MNENRDAWMISQVQRMARTRPGRLTSILLQLRERHPEAFEELVLTALEHGDLSCDRCAQELGVDQPALEAKQEAFRQMVSDSAESPVISKDSHGTARVNGTMIAVWEIVRKFRKSSSVSDLRDSFTSLTELELRAALSYAGRHPDEIQGQISAYDELKRQGVTSAVVQGI